ncbi:MAG TPA: branched-chain amino acid ABC transporter permease [Holophaga sp.]|nr:branched-chain amino acid ABC transporter permease [Holophaga sp.]HPS66919.1 branched-chain amino acid ABC transporter permease [Holophaga sp.]
MFWQEIINGISIGGVYALMAVGYSLVYSVLNFSNFAHGEVLMVGAYAGFYGLTALHLPFSLALGLSIIVGGLVAILLEKIGYRPLRMRNAPTLYLMISAMGLSIFLQNFVMVTIGPNFRNYPEVFAFDPIEFGSLVIGSLDLVIFIITILSLAVLTWFIYGTRLGMAIQAAAYNMRTATLMGINPDLVVMIVFAMAGSSAGIAGVMFGMKYTVYPWMGNITIKAFIAAVVGGLGSLPGAVVGAFLLGITETLAAAFVSSAFRDLFSFALMILIIIVRPSGLMGVIAKEKA